MLRWAAGDFDAFFNLAAQNLSNLLAFVSILEATWTSAGVSEAKIQEIVYDHIVPGFGVSLAVGACFYAGQAVLEERRTGRTDVCAQPFGVNTPGAYVFISSVVAPVFAAKLLVLPPDEAAHASWSTAVAANMMQGLFELLFAAVGPYLQRIVPLVALLTALSSVGMAYLYMNLVSDEMTQPLISIGCLVVVMSAYLGDIRLGRLPVPVYVMLFGTVVAWVQGAAAGWPDNNNSTTSIDDAGVSPQRVHDALALVDAYPPRLSVREALDFSALMPYVSIVVPVALTVAIGTIQCVQFAAECGDVYSVRASMAGDGLATCVSALCGGIFGMTVYIGHPTFKALGAGYSYNLLTAVLFLTLTSSGLVGLVLAAVPVYALNPIILFVGLAVCADTLKLTPSRHFPAFIFGLGPALAAWCVGVVANAVPELDPSTTPSLIGLNLFGKGYLLSSLVLTALLATIIDRQYARAIAWALIAALLSLCGLMHGERIGLLIHADSYGWRFTTGYTTGAIYLGILWQSQRRGLMDGPRCSSDGGKAPVPTDGALETLRTTVGGEYVPASGLHEPMLRADSEEGGELS